MKCAVTRIFGGLALLLGLTPACSQDMEEQPSFQAQEAPRKHSPPYSIPIESRSRPTTLPSGTAETVQRGHIVYSINCSHCHGPRGHGDGPVAPSLSQTPSNLHSPHVQNKPVLEVFRIVTDGHEAMPAFRGELSTEERWQVAYFVKSLREPQSAMPGESHEH